MSYSIRFTPIADNDFDDILHFIAADSPVRAISFVQNLRERATELLQMFPNSGKRIGNCRMMSLENYIIVYRVDEKFKIVHVLMVTEGHRDWQEILGERT